MEVLLNATGVSKSYGDKTIIRNADFMIGKRTITSFTGKSGEGKSTLARIICGTVTKDTGNIEFEGENLFVKNRFNDKFRRRIQLIPQQPYSSLDPRMTAGQAIIEPLLYHKIESSKRDAEIKARALFYKMQLDQALFARRPNELSGGQAQRVLIARALTVAPSLIIADEATSMLDVSSQAQIIQILRDLVRFDGVSVMLISHDLDLVGEISDSIYDLKDGELSKVK